MIAAGDAGNVLAQPRFRFSGGRELDCVQPVRGPLLAVPQQRVPAHLKPVGLGEISQRVARSEIPFIGFGKDRILFVLVLRDDDAAFAQHEVDIVRVCKLTRPHGGAEAQAFCGRQVFQGRAGRNCCALRSGNGAGARHERQ